MPTGCKYDFSDDLCYNQSKKVLSLNDFWTLLTFINKITINEFTKSFRKFIESICPLWYNWKKRRKAGLCMDTVKINKRNTQLVAHRGLSGIETENTNAAFVAAGNRSYYGIETDVHRTADGKFIIYHAIWFCLFVNHKLIILVLLYLLVIF